MFRTVSIIVFLITVLAVALHYLAGRLRSRQKAGPACIARGFVYILTLLFLPQQLTLLGKVKKLLYLLAMLCVIVLGVTGFYPVLALNKHIAGYLLMIHVTAGGVFAFCLVLLAFGFAQSHRFVEADWPWLTGLVRREAQRPKLLPGSCDLVRKICFWLLLILALPLMLSVVSSMFPLSGTAGQVLLADIHRYSTLAFAAVAVIHTYLVTGVPKSR